MRDKDSSVSAVRSLGLGHWRIGIYFLTEKRGDSLLKCVHIGRGAHKESYKGGTGDSLPVYKTVGA